MLGNKVVLTLDALVISSKITFQETKNVLKGNFFFFFKKYQQLLLWMWPSSCRLIHASPKELKVHAFTKNIPNNVSQTSEEGI